MSSQIAFVEIGHDKLVSESVLSLLLNQVRQLSLTGESVLFVLVNCLGGIRMPGNSVCRLTDRVSHDRNSVYLAVKRQSNKSLHINELMAKTHAYSGFNGWHILSSLVLFVDSWYSKVIEINLMNYFSLASKNSKLERNKAFSAEIIWIRETIWRF